MLPQLDPQDLANRLSRARIAARRLCATRWLDAAHVRTARERSSMLPAADRQAIAPLIDAAAAANSSGGNADQDSEARLEAAAWQAVQAIVDPLGRSRDSDDRTLEVALQRAVSLYDIILPRADWARLVLAANRPETRPELAGRLAQIGLMLPAQAGQLADLGLVEIALPPEPELIHALASLQGVAAMADPDAVIGTLDMTTSKADDAVDVRAALGVMEWAGRELGKDVTIALLDSGVDRTHPDLRGISHENVRGGAGNDGIDSLGRGTVLAGLIAGSGDGSEGQAFRGIVPRATLVVARVCDERGRVSLGGVLDSLEWAVSTRNADIVVLPAATGDAAGLAVLRLACEALTRLGVLALVGAGDGGPAASTLATPGDVRDVISVGAIRGDGNLAGFSGRGERHAESNLAGKPDCVAPGCDVVGPRSERLRELRSFDETGHYTLINGTAASAALLAGCAGLVLSAARETHGRSTRALQIRDAVLDNCRAVESASPVWEAGNGLPDIGAALAAVQSDTLPTFQPQMPSTDTDTRRLDNRTNSSNSSGASTGSTASGASAAAGNGDKDTDAAAVDALARDLMDEYDRRRLEAELGAEEAMAAETARGHIRLMEVGDDAEKAAATAAGTAVADRSGKSAPATGNGGGMRGPFEPNRERSRGSGAGPFTDRERERERTRGSRDNPDDRDATADSHPALTASPLVAASSRVRDAEEEADRIHDGDLSHPDGLDPDVCRKLEHEFLNGFEARLYTVPAVPNPMEGGKRYEIHPAGETTSLFSDRDALKKLLIESGDAEGDMRRFPHNRGMEISLIRKKLFGPKLKKMSFVGTCWSPLDELVKTGRARSQGTRRTLVKLVERVVTDANCYYWIGAFSSTGWNADARDANVRGANYVLFLLECDEENGFRAFAPPDMDLVVRNAFDPEDEMTKLNRARRRLDQLPHLKAPGGFMIITELAEVANVPESIALQAARDHAEANDGVRLEKVDGTIIVRRKRF